MGLREAPENRFATLSGSIGPVLNRLSDDIESIGTQLRELLVLQAQANKEFRQQVMRQSGGDTAVENARRWRACRPPIGSCRISH